MRDAAQFGTGVGFCHRKDDPMVLARSILEIAASLEASPRSKRVAAARAAALPGSSLPRRLSVGQVCHWPLRRSLQGMLGEDGEAVGSIMSFTP